MAVTNADLYASIRDVRAEFNKINTRMEDRITRLETIELVNIERRMAKMELEYTKSQDKLNTNQVALSTKFLMVGTITVIILNGLVYFLAQELAK